MKNSFDEVRNFISENLKVNCEKCSNNSNIVLFEPLTEKCEEVGIVFLGLSPGEAELKAGHPFASEEDQVCRKIFIEQGITECGILLFNACCCMHMAENPPTEKEIYYCFDNFEKALEFIPSNAVIVPTGAPSLRRMGITDDPIEAMDKIYSYEGHVVLPMVHISSVNKGDVSKEHFVKRLVQAKEIYLRGEMPKIEEANMRKAQDVKNVLYKLMEK